MSTTVTAPRRVAELDANTGELLSLRGEVVLIKRVPAGQPVSYSGLYVTAAETDLALVALGYADGIPRHAQGGPIFLAGREFRICGRVAMDQVVVDVGTGSGIQAGDPVVVYSPELLPRPEWAARAGVPDAQVSHYLGARVAVEYLLEIPTSEAMEALGARLARQLRAGDALILTGALGAGKTTLTRGLGAALGVVGTVQSPTFVIARTHESASVPLLHVDAYRLGDEALLDDLDLDFAGSITVAEWGEPLTHALDAWVEVAIERAPGSGADPLAEDADDPRRVRIRAGGTLSRERLREIVEPA